eukprot:scaffold299708_cov32-Tisochrysis_lutea.AAC.5
MASEGLVYVQPLQDVEAAVAEAAFLTGGLSLGPRKRIRWPLPIAHPAELSKLLTTPNHAMETPIYLCALRGHALCCALLLDAGGDELFLNATYHDGWTPIHAAIISRSTPLLAMLLERGAAACQPTLPRQLLARGLACGRVRTRLVQCAQCSSPSFCPPRHVRLYVACR